MNGLVESDVRAAAARAAKTAAHIAERGATREKKFIWIRRNPLKSPESTKENQRKPRKTKEIKAFLFGFICYLVLFGQICIGLCGARRLSVARGRLPALKATADPRRGLLSPR
jgi:hypothetical protein